MAQISLYSFSCQGGTVGSKYIPHQTARILTLPAAKKLVAVLMKDSRPFIPISANNLKKVNSGSERYLEGEGLYAE